MNTARILVVDDSTMVLELVKMTFQLYSKDQYAYDIFYASDGEHGLDQVRKLHPDVILLDFNMPGLDGGEVLQLLRSSGITTPIIMMTAHPSEYIAEGTFVQCNGYITKPFKLALLYQEVQNHL